MPTGIQFAHVEMATSVNVLSRGKAEHGAVKSSGHEALPRGLAVLAHLSVGNILVLLHFWFYRISL